MSHIKSAIAGTALLTAGVFMIPQAMAAQAATQGLYSADELMDAPVYLQSDPKNEAGEVENILLGDDMSVQAIVIETGDIGHDKNFVIEKGKFTVETTQDSSLEDTEYKVTVDLSEEQLNNQPEYTNDWWQDAKKQASTAWEKTKNGAESAWKNTREATSNLLDNASNAVDK
ncbi:PRC-barrel domain containing protein [Larsenimonas rhizosphaerae]|uniref:PRC-barrel domain containing protein n=1 Tax=Larsenimonas rhizosphaerae TaxID=2944682 RepID=A0AA42CUZ8_9GAMM|nr:PRC-barrel domain containing protein [Larsenimonas rhizosphaerae]MCM2131759.1 PRC-barrel domain containing protein [Larsenimonas rhizosphaerae]MCX2524914.1 PRC-barrel domain containing protein [Larsenimonas rhizosphaerae]